MKKRSTGNGTEGMGAWTVGMDLGDRTSHICVLDEGGTVVERVKVQTTREGVRKRFEGVARMRIALEVGTHSPWVSLYKCRNSPTPGLRSGDYAAGGNSASEPSFPLVKSSEGIASTPRASRSA